MIKFTSYLFLLFSVNICVAQLTVNNNITPEKLVETLVGSGVEVKNISVSGSDIAYGVFSGTSNVGIDNDIIDEDDGIILTTGDATLAKGPNNLENASENNFSPVTTDPDLQQLIPDYDLKDACIVEFDFIPEGDSLSFQYVFGSEEYSEFLEGDFNDVFGFFVSGPGISGAFSNNAENLAVVPGTDIPISIQTINNGPVKFDMEEARSFVDGPCVNCEYFKYNGNGDDFFNENFFYNEDSIQYDGFTTVLTAGIGALIPGEEYHIKLAIADAGDPTYDTGVFLASKSFSTNKPLLTASGYEGETEFVNAAAGCTNGRFTFEFEEPVACDVTVGFEIGGTAVAGVDYTAFPTTIDIPKESSTETINVEILDDGMTAGSKTLELYITSISDDACADINMDTISLTIEDAPVFSVTESKEIMEGDMVELVASGGLNYNWLSGGFDNPQENSQTANPAETTAYMVAIDYGRCTDTLTTEITVTQEPIITSCELNLVEMSVTECNDVFYRISIKVSGGTVGDLISVKDREASVIGTFTITDDSLGVELGPISIEQTVLTISNESDSTCEAISVDSTTEIIECLDVVPCFIFVTMGNVVSCTRTAYNLQIALQGSGNGDSFMVQSTAGEVYGVFNYADVPVTIENIPVDQTVLTIQDMTIPDCTAETVDIFPVVQACVNLIPQCSAIEATATVTNCTADSYDVDLNIISNSTGDSFSVTDNSGNSLGIYNYADVPVSISSLSLSVTSLTVKDSDNDDCTNDTDDLTEMVTACQGNLQMCSINIEASNVTFCTEAMYTLSLNLSGNDTGATFSVQDMAGNNLGTFNYADVPVEIDSISVDIAAITVSDDENADCTSIAGLATAIQNCMDNIGEMDCTVSAIATVSACTEETYTANLMVNGSNTGTSFTVTDGSGNDLGTYEYAASPVEIASIPVAAAALTIADAENAACTTKTNDLTTAIAICMGEEGMECAVSVAASVSSCTQETYTASLTVGADNTGTSFILTDGAGNNLGTFNYSSDVIEVADIPVGAAILTITDSENSNCTANSENLATAIQACIDEEPAVCSIATTALIVTECADDTYSVSLSIMGMNAGDTFTITDSNGAMLGDFTYSNTPVSLSGIAIAETVLTINDNGIENCSVTADFGTALVACLDSETDCTGIQSAGSIAVTNPYVCDGATPEISITGSDISNDYRIFYVFHSNPALSVNNLSDTQVFGLSFDDLIIPNGLLPCGIPLYVTAVATSYAENLSDINFNSNCLAFSNTSEITFLCPIKVNVKKLCNQATGLVTVNVVVKGGLPEVDVESEFDITGDIYAGNINHDEQITIGDLQDGSNYTITATDAYGCSTTLEGALLCEKKLPIELLTFTGEAKENGNLLKWITATEIDNDFFTIEHSLDAVNYSALATINGSGTANTAIKYEHLDRVALNGTTYYRLSQTDFDGTTKIVGFTDVHRGEGIGVELAGIYPMPFLNELTIQLSSIENIYVRLSLTDLSGRLILRDEYNLNSGLTNVPINTTPFASGLYLLRIETAAGSIVKKMIKE